MRCEVAARAEGTYLLGHLEHETGRVPVRVRCASRTTLAVAFPVGLAPLQGTVFPRLVVRLGPEQAQLSRCRLEWEDARFGGEGRLVFLDDVYDCHRLVADRRVVAVSSSFQNVPLVLAQKGHIRPEFRESLADLLYDLASYKKLFDEQDALLEGEPEDVVREAQEAVLATEGRSFLRFLDRRLDELGGLVRGFDRRAHEQHGFYLRRLASEFIACSALLERSNRKPWGYAGDAATMGMLYENRYVGPSLFSKLMHKHPLETPMAQAVRGRPGVVAGALGVVRSRLPAVGPGGLRVLSVGAGPAWELQALLRNEEDLAQVHCVLLDRDPRALGRARETVQHVEALRGGRARVDYVRASVRTVGAVRTPAMRRGPFQLVYAMGLLDELAEPVARVVLRRLFGLLAPGGALVVSHALVGSPSRFHMAYWMDWAPLHRTAEELAGLAEGLPGACVSVSGEPTGSEAYLRVERVG